MNISDDTLKQYETTRPLVPSKSLFSPSPTLSMANLQTCPLPKLPAKPVYLEDEEHLVNSAQFSPDGRHVTSGDEAGLLMVCP